MMLITWCTHFNWLTNVLTNKQLYMYSVLCLVLWHNAKFDIYLAHFLQTSVWWFFPGQLGVGAAVGTTVVVVTVFILIIIVIIVTTLVILIMKYRKRIGYYFVPEGNVVVLLSQVYMLIACLANYMYLKELYM